MINVSFLSLRLLKGEATLRIDENAQPKVLPCRKLPLAIEDTEKKELDPLIEDVLVPVTEPTEWVSQMAVVHKPNCKLRTCIDPQPLNACQFLMMCFPSLRNPKFSASSMCEKLIGMSG